MRLLTGADILAFHTSGNDLLAISTSGEFVHHDAADLDGRTDSYSYATTDGGDEVQILLEASTIKDGDWFPGALDEDGDLIPMVADEMAAIINSDAGLHTRLQVEEIREATTAWEDSTRETNRLSDDRARRIAAFVKHCGGNQSAAARLLGLDQSTVNKLVRKANRAAATVGARITVPADSIPEDWARTGEIVEVNPETVVVELAGGHRQELPTDDVTPA